MVLLYRWSFYTGGPSIQVVLLYRWSVRQVSLYVHTYVCVSSVIERFLLFGEFVVMSTISSFFSSSGLDLQTLMTLSRPQVHAIG